MNKFALITGVLILIADQITKAVAVHYFAAGKLAILPIFNLVLVWNRGVSFGMFSGAGNYGPLMLTIISIIMIGCLFIWLGKVKDKGLEIAIFAVIAGAIGNVIDRVRYGAVVDFLDFHLGAWHYPAFNIADSAIVLGIAFILFDSIFLEAKRNGSQNNEN